jgi:hypothetical protein
MSIIEFIYENQDIINELLDKYEYEVIIKYLLDKINGNNSCRFDE